MKFENFRNEEILNENPRLIYVEADYKEIKDDFSKYVGYVERTENEEKCILCADVPEKIKQIFKKSMLEDFLHPKQYKIIGLEE